MRRQTVKASEHQNSDLELGASLHAQPVTIVLCRRYVIEFSLITHEEHNSVHHGLQFF
jgi:hypothetical protein